MHVPQALCARPSALVPYAAEARNPRCRKASLDAVVSAFHVACNVAPGQCETAQPTDLSDDSRCPIFAGLDAAPMPRRRVAAEFYRNDGPPTGRIDAAPLRGHAWRRWPISSPASCRAMTPCLDLGLLRSPRGKTTTNPGEPRTKAVAAKVAVTEQSERRESVKLLFPSKPPTWALPLYLRKQHLRPAPERERWPVLFRRPLGGG